MTYPYNLYRVTDPNTNNSVENTDLLDVLSYRNENCEGTEVHVIVVNERTRYTVTQGANSFDSLSEVETNAMAVSLGWENPAKDHFQEEFEESDSILEE